MREETTDHQRVISYSIDVYITLGLISLVAFLAVRLLSPFSSVLLWALILAVALYPVFETLRRWLGGHGGIAATLIAVLSLLLLIGPAILILDSIIDTTASLAAMLTDERLAIPAPDPAVREWPLIGEAVFDLWTGAHADLDKTVHQFAPQLRGFGQTILGTGAGLLIGILEFAVSIVFAAIFMSYAHPLGALSDSLANRVASHRGRIFVTMAVATVRNVSRGVIGVAVIQGGLAALVMIAMEIPYAGVLSALAIGAAIVQIPVIVILPTIVYVWTAEPTMTAAVYTALMVPVMLVDNVLKPIFMARGLDTPMVVILVGVIGGTLNAGLVGLFVGPVVLAVFYDMLKVWIGAVAPRVGETSA